LRIATFQHDGRRQVGALTPDGQALQAFTGLDAGLGALPLIELAATGQPLPQPDGPVLPLAQVRLEAPLPRPLRNLWCVGRNYHAHARSCATRSSAPAR
jgi:2-keto-4-pentenoate hydratase/2-oxohepta-3-ene-1,7-dioic acid hydratase in catechol pathway